MTERYVFTGNDGDTIYDTDIASEPFLSEDDALAYAKSIYKGDAMIHMYKLVKVKTFKFERKITCVDDCGNERLNVVRWKDD